LVLGTYRPEEVLGKEHPLTTLTRQTEAGLRLLAEALAVMERSGERWWEAEVHRLKGEILRKQAAADEHQAAACFRQALDVARCQKTRSLELRVATSLGRLWQRQGKHEAAYDLLAPIYNWFTEGFDTADLKEAKALLEELAALIPCGTPECGGDSYPPRRCGPGHQS
jgi:predicted ATPase